MQTVRMVAGPAALTWKYTGLGEDIPGRPSLRGRAREGLAKELASEPSPKGSREEHSC